jgi:hypothetical protein
MICGSVWGANCAAVIYASRAKEVTTAIERWAGPAATRRDTSVSMLTLTVAHEYGDDLHTVCDVLSRAKSALFRGEPGARLRRMLGMKHSVRAREVTYGRNGWHPHFHILIFHERPPAPGALEALLNAGKRWWRAFARRRLRTSGTEQISPLCRIHRKARARDHEHHQQERKNGSLAPWEIARRAARGGGAESERLWVEYTEGMHGAQQLVWSDGARDALGLKEPDDDVEHAVEDHGMPVAKIEKPVWKYCSNMPGWTVELLHRARSASS